jgi:hypothetical protein
MENSVQLGEFWLPRNIELAVMLTALCLRATKVKILVGANNLTSFPGTTIKTEKARRDFLDCGWEYPTIREWKCALF